MVIVVVVEAEGTKLKVQLIGSKECKTGRDMVGTSLLTEA